MSILLKSSLLIIFILQVAATAGPTNTLLEDLKMDKRISPEIFEELQLKRSSKVNALVVLSLDDTRSGSRKQKVAEATKSILQHIANISKEHIQINQVYESIRAVAITVGLDGMKQLLRHPSVVRIGLDVVIKRGEGENPSLKEARIEERTGGGIPVITVRNREVLRNCNFDQTHEEGATGKGVNVAVVDGGLDTLVDFKLGRKIFTSEHCFGSIPKRCRNGKVEHHGPGAARRLTGGGILALNGHGTEVSSQVLMAAPDASITAIDINGGQGSLLLRILDYIANHLPEVRVINMSMGFTTKHHDKNCHTTEALGLLFFEIVEVLNNQGVVAVATTGNSSIKDGEEMPACLSNIISVAGSDYSVKNYPTIAGYSSVSRFTDSAAPGDASQISADGVLSSGSGTSFAAPIVAGCIASLLQKVPEATPDQVRNALRVGSDIIIVKGDLGHTVPGLACGKALDHLESYAEYNSNEGGAPHTTQGICSRSPQVRNGILSTIYQRKAVAFRNLQNQVASPISSHGNSHYYRLEESNIYRIPHASTDYEFEGHNSSIRYSYSRKEFSIWVTRDDFGPHLLTGTISDSYGLSHWSLTVDIIPEGSPYIKTRNPVLKLGKSLSYQLAHQDIHTTTGFYDIQVTSPESVSFDTHSRTFLGPLLKLQETI